MTNRFVKLMLAMLFFSTTAFSQVDNFDFLRAGSYDASSITQAYVAPWANAFGAGVNGNWYNTAKPHKFGGFDITIGANVGFVPSSDNTFDVTKIGLKTFSGTGLAPTISGVGQPGAHFNFCTSKRNCTYNISDTCRVQTGDICRFQHLQAGIGLPLGSEVKIVISLRYQLGKEIFQSWGVGLMHSIMQYFPGDKIFPFDISVIWRYTLYLMGMYQLI